MKISVLKNICWGLIPARGGSKSVPLKNLAPLAGRPLIDYTIAAAEASRTITRLICTTDSEQIAARCNKLGTEVQNRPAYLSNDDVAVQSVISHAIKKLAACEEGVAEYIALLQPTSPFLLPDHIDACVSTLRGQSDAGSAQTVIECPHNHHAVNQRVLKNTGCVAFRYPEARRNAYNKQRKQRHYLFGNLVVFRSLECLKQNTPFCEPSLPVAVDTIYGFDADGPYDFTLGSLIIQNGLISLPHMASEFTTNTKTALEAKENGG